MLAAFSSFSLLALNSAAPADSVPEMTLISDSLPTNGSAMVLKTCAVNDSFRSQWRTCTEPVLGLTPWNEWPSGEGMYIASACSSGATPMPVVAETGATGTTEPS